MTRSPEHARHDALVATHRLRPHVTVEIPWPTHWRGNELGAFALRMWNALAPDDALGPSVQIGENRYSYDTARFTADGFGITCVSRDYGAVPGDATITHHTLVHPAWMVHTHDVSDCTMTSLSVEVHAAAEQLEKLAAIVQQLLAEERPRP